MLLLLFAKELSQIFDEAENDDNGGACQSNEKQHGEEMRTEVRESVHRVILRAPLHFATSL